MKRLLEVFMHMHDDRHPIGTVVLTPSGRRAIVKKYLSGASKRDAFDRVVVRYFDGDARDLVTLQPHQIRLAPVEVSTPSQLDLEFA